VVDLTREAAPCHPPPIWSASSLEIERDMLRDVTEWDARVAAEAAGKRSGRNSCIKRRWATPEARQASERQKRPKM
jgi:hypothetical protein